MLTLANSLLELIKAHAVDSYPNECSGLIVGLYDKGVAKRIFPMKNVHSEGTHNRYLIDPKEYVQVEKQARSLGQDVIGIYHSHPDVPAKPSQYDTDHTWPFYTYVIASVMKKKVDHVLAWTLRDDKTGFDEAELRVVE
jgi:proteasome lid subunit RPN8/RPN11